MIVTPIGLMHEKREKISGNICIFQKKIIFFLKMDEVFAHFSKSENLGEI